MSTSALIGRKPMAISRCCSHFGDGPFLTPFTRRSAKPGQSSGASIVTLTGVSPLPLIASTGARLQPAKPARRQIAGDAVDAGRVGPVRRQIDLDDRIVEMRVGCEAGADRRIVRQVDDAIMLVGQFQLALGAHHAMALDAADLADRQRHVDAGHIGAGRGEGADQAGAGIRRAAHHLDRRLAVAGVDGQHPQPVGVGMLHRRQHLGDDEGLQARPCRRHARLRDRSRSAARRSRRAWRRSRDDP